MGQAPAWPPRCRNAACPLAAAPVIEPRASTALASQVGKYDAPVLARAGLPPSLLACFTGLQSLTLKGASYSASKKLSFTLDAGAGPRPPQALHCHLHCHLHCPGRGRGGPPLAEAAGPAAAQQRPRSPTAGTAVLDLPALRHLSLEGLRVPCAHGCEGGLSVFRPCLPRLTSLELHGSGMWAYDLEYLLRACTSLGSLALLEITSGAEPPPGVDTTAAEAMEGLLRALAGLQGLTQLRCGVRAGQRPAGRAGGSVAHAPPRAPMAGRARQARRPAATPPRGLFRAARGCCCRHLLPTVPAASSIPLPFPSDSRLRSSTRRRRPSSASRWPGWPGCATSTWSAACGRCPPATPTFAASHTCACLPLHSWTTASASSRGCRCALPAALPCKLCLDLRVTLASPM